MFNHFKISKDFKISVIVTTYNWPEALSLVIKSLLLQTDNNFEIIIADDGSDERTKLLIEEYQNKYTQNKNISINIKHIWQPDNGFRAAAIRNQAVLASTGDYIIFLDGDCIPFKDFVKKHRKLAEFKTLVVGNRILLNQYFTQVVLKESLAITDWTFAEWCYARIKSYCNQVLPLVKIPLGPLRKLFPRRWQGAKGCNLGVWKKDIMQINGFEESFQGWGYEDTDFVVRLFSSGVLRKEGRFAVPVIHLWHKENDRTHAEANRQLWLSRQQDECVAATQGLLNYLQMHPVEKDTLYKTTLCTKRYLMYKTKLNVQNDT